MVQAKVQPMVQVQRLVNAIREDTCTFSDILKRLHLKGRNNVVVNYLKPAIEGGYVLYKNLCGYYSKRHNYFRLLLGLEGRYPHLRGHHKLHHVIRYDRVWTECNSPV